MTGQDWRDDAACRDIDDPDIFFPPKGNTYRAARRVCLSCPVRLECAVYAFLAEADPDTSSRRYGMFGGLTPEERDAVADTAQRARDRHRRREHLNNVGAAFLTELNAALDRADADGWNTRR